jgi:predicted DNA-binding transcriptional regulator YafY
MRRADRLFQIVQILRRHRRRGITAAQIAEILEISERTVYRDMRDLMASGVQVQGEAGVGYRLDAKFELPPMSFAGDEIEALVLGARMVERFADDGLRQAALSILDKVHAVLPESERERLDSTALFALTFAPPNDTKKHLALLRRAIGERKKVELLYEDAHGTVSERQACPLGLYFWGHVWSLGTWCDLRKDYRNFRVDRMRDVHILEEQFALESPITREEFVLAMQNQVKF